MKDQEQQAQDDLQDTNKNVNDNPSSDLNQNSDESGQEYSFSLKIPRERVAVLIGKNGSEKREIESLAKIRLNINSEEGDVEIFTKDPVQLFTAKEIVKAIGRGFNPKIALQLLKQDYSFEQIVITDYVKHKNHVVRVRARLIGKEGKARTTIENLTDTNISVYGKTVSIIGRIDYVSVAKHALISLIQGSPHSNVYRYLEKRRREFREMELKEPGF